MLFAIALLIGAGALYAAAPGLGIGTTRTKVIGVTHTVGGNTNTITTIGRSTVTTTVLSPGSGLSGNITLGAIYPISGGAAATGQQEKVSTDLAIKDVNAVLQGSKLNLRFQVKIEDSGSEPSRDLGLMQNLASQGVREFLGMTYSPGIRSVLNYSYANHLVILSSLSNTHLNAPRNYIFRNVPPDAAQGPAIARNMIQQGYDHVIVLYRNDSYGVSVSASFGQSFSADGGMILDSVSYDPFQAAYNFSAQLNRLQTDYSNAVAMYGPSHVAMESLMFEEESTFITQMQSYSTLTAARWFAWDEIAMSTSLLQEVGNAAAQMKLDATYAAPPRSSLFLAFEQRFRAATGGMEPDTVAAEAYDDVWIMANAIIEAGTTDGAAVQKVMIPVANTYYGVDGWPNFSAAGDRQSSNYDIYQVQKVAGNATWVLIGSWDPVYDSVSFSSPH